VKYVIIFSDDSNLCDDLWTEKKNVFFFSYCWQC